MAAVRCQYTTLYFAVSEPAASSDRIKCRRVCGGRFKAVVRRIWRCRTLNNCMPESHKYGLYMCISRHRPLVYDMPARTRRGLGEHTPKVHSECPPDRACVCVCMGVCVCCINSAHKYSFSINVKTNYRICCSAQHIHHSLVHTHNEDEHTTRMSRTF